MIRTVNYFNQDGTLDKKRTAAYDKEQASVAKDDAIVAAVRAKGSKERSDKILADAAVLHELLVVAGKTVEIRGAE